MYLKYCNYTAKLTDKLHWIQSDLLSEGFISKQDLTFKDDSLTDHIYMRVL